MNDIETNGRKLARRARTLADLTSAETSQFGGWLLDVMSRLIMVHDDQIVALHLREMANEAYDYGILPAAHQKALGVWVETEMDALRARDRRAAYSTDRRAGRGDAAVLDAFVATVESAGYNWLLGRSGDRYGAVVYKSPVDDGNCDLSAPDAAHGATALEALSRALRQATGVTAH